MAKPFTKNLDTAECVQMIYANTKDAAQEFLVHAKETAQSTAANMKDRAWNTFSSAKGTTQEKLADRKDFAQARLKTTRDVTRDKMTKVLESTKIGLDKALDLLTTGVGIAATLLYDNRRKAQQKLQQAQTSLLKTATPIVERTQDVVVTSTKKAGQSFQKAAANAKDLKEALQGGYAYYQQQRRRKRILFRIGLLAGVAVAVLYTPLTGSDVRHRIAQQWQQCRNYFGV